MNIADAVQGRAVRITRYNATPAHMIRTIHHVGVIEAVRDYGYIEVRFRYLENAEPPRTGFAQWTMLAGELELA